MKKYFLNSRTLIILITCVLSVRCDRKETFNTQPDVASIGDFYYSDGSWSSDLDHQKEAIGIIFSFSEKKGGSILHGSTKGLHGRVVALNNIIVDGNEWLPWGEYGGNREIPGLSKHATIDGEHYYYFINTENTSNWHSGALSDFEGAKNTKMILKHRGEREILENKPSDYPAASFCDLYGDTGWEFGKPGEWYLPACGEAALLYARKDLIADRIKKCGGQPSFGSYLWTSTAFDWKANIGKHDITENLSGSSWAIYFTYGMIVWPTRDCPKPVRPIMAF